MSSVIYLILILYFPDIIDLPESYNTFELGKVNITCVIKENYTASVIWRKEENPDFIQYGTQLLLENIQTTDAGTYICIAAVTDPPPPGTVSKTMQLLVECK